jgi:hypothetical protein
MKTNNRRLLAALALAASASVAAAPPTIGGCQVFPSDNYWNTPVDTLPVHPFSSVWVATVGNTAKLHPDWGLGPPTDNYGIPFTTVTSAQPLVAIVDNLDSACDCNYGDESDPGPYPIPANAPIEGAGLDDGDRHVLVVETTSCVLYELYHAYPQPGGAWMASSYAKWPLNSNALRPDGWTSADAAGLPILPGLVRYEEALTGEIAHAIRFTAALIWGRENGQQKYLWPGRHASGSSTAFTRPPMGARFRLKSSYNIPGSLHPITQTILRAFKKYGLVLADGGSNWYFQGVSSPSWPDAVFNELKQVAGSNFEVVDTSLLQTSVNSAQAKQNVEGNAPAPAQHLDAAFRAFGQRRRDRGVRAHRLRAEDRGRHRERPLACAVRHCESAAQPAAAAHPHVRQRHRGIERRLGTAANSAQLSALGYAPSNAVEAAVLVTLQPGAYTAIVSGAGGTTGVGIVEVYELDRPDVPLINISTRGHVGTDSELMIGGFIVTGNGPQTVVVTAKGPSLAAFGIAGTLANPTLTLVRASDNTVIATNDDWQQASNAAQIQAAGFAPSNPLESAILMTLPPGAYTAIVSGVNNGTGVGIVEVYAVSGP